MEQRKVNMVVAELDYEKLSGFNKLLADLKNSFAKPISLSGLSDSIFTAGGRQPWSFGFSALSAREKETFNLLKNATVYPFLNKSVGLFDLKYRLVVGIRKYGRVFIESYDECKDTSSIYLGFINLKEENLQALSAIEVRVQLLCEQGQSESNSYIREHSSADYVAMVKTVKHAIDHIDPILIYTHDSLFTNFASFNNLLGKLGKSKKGMFLDDLVNGIHRKLSADDVEFLYCYFVLKSAGFRGEEFSGQQLTCSYLHDYLNEKIFEYQDLLYQKKKASQDNLIKKAKLCKSLKESLHNDYFCYRRVNGLCFNKTEHYNMRNTQDLSTASLPVMLCTTLQNHFGVSANNYDHVDGYFDSVVERALEISMQPSDIDLMPLEQLLELVVRSAMKELKSDISMTRGFRNLYKLYLDLKNSDEEAICKYSAAEYFCAVFMSEKTKNHLIGTPSLYKKVSTAIASRMTFNSWHYTPGHFGKGTKDGLRHYYMPPKMTDSAVWSDQHHTGHVLAHVRYSIRSPSSLLIDGEKYYGVSDLRLMRRSDSPYTDGELMRAREYSGYLRAIYQSILDCSVKKGMSFPIKAFSKEWYNRKNN